jgi:hypothetical protein
MMPITKEIIVQSIVQAYYFTCQVPWACISIVTVEDSWPKIHEANRMGLLQLAFADIATAEGSEQGAFIAPSR